MEHLCPGAQASWEPEAGANQVGRPFARFGEAVGGLEPGPAGRVQGQGRARVLLHRAEDAVAACDSDGGDRCSGAWGLGTGAMPLKPDLLCKPCFTSELGKTVEDW
eukprot:9583399-Lingulodinium_polyedra.AAC.1